MPAQQDPSWVDNEVGIIERALREQGDLNRQDLARRVGARYWGPGRFRSALRTAITEGAARRVGRDRYGPGDGEAPKPAGSPETPTTSR